MHTADPPIRETSRKACDRLDPAAVSDQIVLPCVVMRGGTSKALFFHEADLPPPGPARNTLFKRAMGTPDPAQIDGMGGSKLNTSKVAIIERSTRADADIDFTFAQVELAADVVSYDGNCGNVSSAVGPFAIDEGLVAAAEPVTVLRIYNTNTDKVLVARVPVSGGRAKVAGDCVVAGVPGSGAEILMDYAETVGSRTGALLPTGHVVDNLHTAGGREIAVSVCDVGNPCIFVAAGSLGLRGDEKQAEIAANTAVLALTEELRGRIGQSLGFWPDWRAQGLPAMPMTVIVAPPRPGEAVDLHARLIYQGYCHESMAGTGAICLAAASRVPGSIAHQAATGVDGVTLKIGHPQGSLDVRVVGRSSPTPGNTVFAMIGFARTARRLMKGELYLPRCTADPAAI